MGYYDPPEPTWAGDMDVVCGQDAEFTVVDQALLEELDAARKYANAYRDTPGAPNSADVYAGRLAKHIELLNRRVHSAQTVTTDCPFEGNVEAEVVGGTLYWQCPTCGAEHEEDPRP